MWLALWNEQETTERFTIAKTLLTLRVFMKLKCASVSNILGVSKTCVPVYIAIGKIEGNDACIKLVLLSLLVTIVVFCSIAQLNRVYSIL